MTAVATIDGRYERVRILGCGEQGEVWLVWDRDRGEEVVLKLVGDAGDAAAVVGEFAHLARLEDPALPRVREVGIAASGRAYFTAAWIDGVPLLEAVAAASQRERARLIWSVARDVAGALATLHAAGVLHHDVTPANVMVVGRGAEARGVLVDLGLATRGRTKDARGTPAYLAPEALVGDAGSRSDLWGLGATLHHAATGAPPFADLHAILTKSPPPTALPPPLAAIVGRLLRRDPAERPASAVALAALLDDVAAAIAPPPRPRAAITVRAPAVRPALVGAAPAIAAITTALDDAAAGRAVAPIRVSGRHGARVGDVVAEAVRRHQLACAGRGEAPARITSGAPAELTASGTPGAIAAALAHRRDGGPDAVVIALAGDDALIRLLAAAAPDVTVIAWLETDAVVAPVPGVREVTVAPVGVADIAALARELIGRDVPAPWAAALHRVSAGLPGLAAAIVEAARATSDPFAVDPGAITGDAAELAAVIAARIDEHDPAIRALAQVVGAFDGRVAIDVALDATARALAAPAAADVGLDATARALAAPAATADAAAAMGRAIASGLIGRDGDEVAVAPRIAAELARRATTATYAAAAAAARHAGLDAVVCAPLLAGARDLDAAATAATAAAMLLERGQPSRALAMTEIAARTTEPVARARAQLLAARAATPLGDYARARREAASAASEPRLPAAERATARLVAARASQRSGDLDLADHELAELASELDGDALAAEVRGTRARLLVARGRYRDALDEAARAGDDPGALEAAGLAALYLGDLDAAAARFATLRRRADDAADPAPRGRAAALAAMVALQRGDLAAASTLQAEAGVAARAAGDFHAAAVADLNLATALAEQGRHGDALPVVARAIAALDALGAHGERAAAEFNRGNALFAVGDLAGADQAARAALDGARDGDVVTTFARLLLGDLARRRGDAAAARAAYDTALTGATGGHARLCALAARAELAVAERDVALARRLIADADVHAGSPDDRARLAAIRAGAARLDGGAAALTAALDAERAGRDVLAAGRADRGWRTLLAAAEARVAGGADASALLAEARAIRRALVDATPEAWRAHLDDDPDAQRLADPAPDPSGARHRPLPARNPRSAMSTDAAFEIARLRRLLALSRRLNSEHSLDRLLDDVIDAAIETTEAERGFLLLRAEPGQPLEVVVARNFAVGALDDAAGKISRSIADRAATTGEPVITVDAGIDERFGAATSVAALRLRSVMAVPLRQKGRITGCIYVDHRLRDGAFDDHAAGLALELADIAAVAIENARLGADLRRRQDENDALASRLAAELAERDAELTAVRARLPDRDALRYPTIVGGSPAITAMLGLVERAARTVLPVVVVGESGTGKELVARALHDHGGRADKPFVAVNCSAMPEPLLESELFGHVRGAFTGADRDRRGLFEVADGGTLFLDEVADTTPAMQAKLLRVVQDGHVRRVGDERTRKVDVRLVVASQRPLAELVAAGRFRDDLRFRLEVIQVTVPPLRARLEDVPLLVEHFLDRIASKLAGGKRPELTRAALRALGHHAWPGNVRELENAIARACALGDDVIDVEDLPETVARSRLSPAAASGPGADLALRPALDLVERAYLEAAMNRTNNNQTAAARLLGLSRFGLQKKLRRLAEE